MPVQYPSFLKLPLYERYSRNEEPQFRETQPMAGPFIAERTTFDTPVMWQLKFRFDGGQQRLFKAWLKEGIDNGVKPFILPLRTESGMTEQEVRFTRAGMPQLTDVNGGIYSYDAMVIARKEVDPDSGEYEFLLGLAEISPDGDINQGLALLDITINEVAP